MQNLLAIDNTNIYHLTFGWLWKGNEWLALGGPFLTLLAKTGIETTAFSL